MKTCKKCEINKSEKEFYKLKQYGKNGEIWNYFDCYCKKCRSLYQSNRVLQIKLLAIEYLGGKCQHCGLIDDPCIYDFHHLDKTKKEFTIAKRKGLSFEKIKKELDKCILLCANCHRKLHSNSIEN